VAISFKFLQDHRFTPPLGALRKNNEEINLNLNEIKEVERERSIICDSNSNLEKEVNTTDAENDYEISVSRDSEFEKEKMMVHNRKEDVQREKIFFEKKRKRTLQMLGVHLIKRGSIGKWW
jgi:hypothetical protein